MRQTSALAFLPILNGCIGREFTFINAQQKGFIKVSLTKSANKLQFLLESKKLLLLNVRLNVIKHISRYLLL